MPIPPGQGRSPAINVAFHPQPNCTGANTYYQANLDPANAVAGWIPLKMDTRDFPDPLSSIIPSNTKSAELLIFTGGPVYFDDIRFFGYLALQGGTYPCFADPLNACLNANGRFQMNVSWEKANSSSGPGWMVPQGRDSATVWFFNKNSSLPLFRVIVDNLRRGAALASAVAEQSCQLSSASSWKQVACSDTHPKRSPTSWPWKRIARDGS